MSKCIGCGIELQDIDKNLDGYVSRDNFRLCERCFRIKNYGENRVVVAGNDDYMKILNSINDDEMVVYVSSLLTLNLDYLDKFKNVILVLTKRDIMPKSIKNEKIIAYIKKRYKINEIVIVSAFKKMNLDCLYNKISEYGRGRKIYFVGSTNSGKSTLINEMIKSYNGVLGEITMSSYPSTTLSKIEVKIGEFSVIDTPGIVDGDSIINYLGNKEIKRLNSKKEIKPITFQIKGSGCILVDKICRIEYETDVSSMTFYVSNNLMVDKISFNNPRLASGKVLEYKMNENSDLVIEDVGFIKMTNPVKVKLIYEDRISVRVRDNLI